MIEKTVLDQLTQSLRHPVYMEIPEKMPDKFYILRKADSGRADMVDMAMFTLRSYAGTLYEAAEMNEAAVEALDALSDLDGIYSSYRMGDYPFDQSEIKKYCYQAVQGVYY